jgi:O-antigen/teichoic acid export membrane protein
MLIRGSAYDQALVVAANFAFTVAMVRVAGVDVYGLYTLLWGVIQLLVAVQGSLVIAPFQSLGHELQARFGDDYLHAVFGHQQLFCALLIPCLAVGVLLFEPQDIMASLPLVVSAAGYVLVTQEYFRRLRLATGRVFSALLGDAFRYVLPVAWISSRPSVTLSEVFVVLGIACAPSLLLSYRSFAFFRGKGASLVTPVLRSHWPFARWLIPSIALQWINANLVFYAVGWFLSQTEVGLLRMAQALSILYLVSLEVLENVVPRQAAMRRRAGGLQEMERYIARVGMWAGIVLAGFLGVVLPWTELWLNLIFGDKAASVRVGFVWLFCLVPSLTLPAYCLNVLHRSLGATRAIFMADALASLASLAGILCIGGYGAVAAIATIYAAQLVRLLTLLFAYRRTTAPLRAL